MTEKTEITIKGLHCTDCVRKVEKGLSSSQGVKSLNLNFTTGKLRIEYEPSEINLNEIHAKIRSLGHEVLEKEMQMEEENLFTLKNPGFLFALISGIALFLGILLEYALEEFVENILVLEVPDFHDIHASGVLFFIAMVFGGVHSVRAAISGLRNKIFVIDLLMLIGATGAVLLGEFAEGAAVLFLFSLAELLEDYSVDRSRRTLRELVDLKPEMVFLKKDGELVEVQADEVKLGDIALVRPGERIGVDGVVLDGRSMVNQAPITGESMPVVKDQGDTVFAGTINQDGRLEIKVEKEAKDSALARIIQMVESAEEHKADTERFVNRFSKYFTPAVVLMAILVTTVPPLLFQQSFEDWFYKALLLLLISCPCALALSTPITIVSGITSGAKQGILFKGGVHLEKLENINIFAFDKTGTLTEGRPVVTDVISLNGSTRESILSVAASLEELSKHPLGTAIVELARQEGVRLEPVTDFRERTGEGIEGSIQGEHFLVGSSRLFKAELQTVFGKEESGGSMLSSLEDQAKTAVIVGRPGKIMGIIGISDRIRDGAREMIKDLKELGINRLVMVTGDNQRTARAVAQAVGIEEYHAELLPGEKVAVIKKLMAEQETSGRRQKKGGVAMVGDGVNDAPALVTADLGIAMGAAGSDTALEVADIALMDEELAKLPTLLSLGRKTMFVIKENIALAIGVKLLFAILVFPGLVTLWMAVAIGDMGVSIAVIANALRLNKRIGGKADEALPGASSCGIPSCTDGCYGDGGASGVDQQKPEHHDHQGHHEHDHHGGCCGADEASGVDHQEHEHHGHHGGCGTDTPKKEDEHCGCGHDHH